MALNLDREIADSFKDFGRGRCLKISKIILAPTAINILIKSRFTFCDSFAQYFKFRCTIVDESIQAPIESFHEYITPRETLENLQFPITSRDYRDYIAQV